MLWTKVLYPNMYIYIIILVLDILEAVFETPPRKFYFMFYWIVRASLQCIYVDYGYIFIERRELDKKCTV